MCAIHILYIYINILTHICTVANIICQTIGGNRVKNGQVEKALPSLDIQAFCLSSWKCVCLFLWLDVSYLCTCGFQLSSARPIGLPCTWISVYAIAGRVMLVCVVSHSLWHLKSLVQHVQVLSDLHVHIIVEGWFHMLINPAVDRKFKYVQTLAALVRIWLFWYTFLLLAKLVSFSSFSIMAYVTPIRNLNTHTRGPIDRVTYGMCS